MSDYSAANVRIGLNVARARIDALLNQTDLAAWLRTHVSVISRIECGKRPLLYSEAVVLAARLDCDLDKFEAGSPIPY